jgi:hypothetical protein
MIVKKTKPLAGGMRRAWVRLSKYQKTLPADIIEKRPRNIAKLSSA